LGSLVLVGCVVILAICGGLLGANEADVSGIVYFGDSLTQGQHADSPEESFVALLRGRIDGHRDRGGETFEKSVISAFGGLYADLRFSEDIGRLPRTLIIVELGAHSVLDDLSLTQSGYRIGYGAMLDCLLGTGAVVVAATVPWLGWDEADPLYARAEAFSLINREEAERRGVPVADIWTAMKGRSELLSFDGFHPNSEGHRVVADVYWEQLEDHIDEPQGDFAPDCDYNEKFDAARAGD
jgi:lysophospholipase L1-like esterase